MGGRSAKGCRGGEPARGLRSCLIALTKNDEVAIWRDKSIELRSYLYLRELQVVLIKEREPSSLREVATFCDINWMLPLSSLACISQLRAVPHCVNLTLTESASTKSRREIVGL